MSTEKTTTKAKAQTSAKPKAKVLRKATFVADSKDEAVFRPVNKRAHKLARLVGRRTRVSKADLKAIKALNKAKLYVYGAEGALKPVRA